MRKVTASVQLATSVRIANVWLLRDGARTFLVDTSHPVERLLLRASLWRSGIRRRGDLDGVILTHRHSDHAGNARWLRDTFDAPVFCHRDDAPFLDGKTRPGRLATSARWLHEHILTRFEDRFPARCPVDDVWDDGPWRHGIRSIAVPGHTEGSSMLYHEPSRTLFSGDAILAGPAPLRAFERLRLAVPGFSLDAGRCHDEVRRYLRDMPPTDTLCSGHGPAVRDNVERKLGQLLSDRR
jgi:glyoxylase-like metal-dependent hydrolase (beta-lactamase superfamily II)